MPEWKYFDRDKNATQRESFIQELEFIKRNNAITTEKKKAINKTNYSNHK